MDIEYFAHGYGILVPAQDRFRRFNGFAPQGTYVTHKKTLSEALLTVLRANSQAYAEIHTSRHKASDTLVFGSKVPSDAEKLEEISRSTTLPEVYVTTDHKLYTISEIICGESKTFEIDFTVGEDFYRR